MDIIQQFLPMIAILVIFIVLLWIPSRRQQKAQAEFWRKLKAGDRVVMNSGIFGKVVSIHQGVVTLEISPGVKLDCMLKSISRMAPQPGVELSES